MREHNCFRQFVPFRPLVIVDELRIDHFLVVVENHFATDGDGFSYNL